MIDLRIQIVNFKTKKYLLECLETMAADLDDVSFTFRVAIVDNASGEDLSDLPDKFPNLGTIEIYHRKQNSGFGAGHNFLAAQGEARHLLLLNPDIKFIEPKTIERLYQKIQEGLFQVVGPRLVTTEAATQVWDHGESLPYFAALGNRFGMNRWKERSSSLEVFWVSGAVFLISKAWYDRLGGFDEHFFLYAEEVDLCLRLQEAGGHALYDPSVSVFHQGSVVAKKSDHLAKSMRYFIHKHVWSDMWGVLRDVVKF